MKLIHKYLKEGNINEILKSELNDQELFGVRLTGEELMDNYSNQNRVNVNDLNKEVDLLIKKKLLKESKNLFNGCQKLNFK